MENINLKLLQKVIRPKPSFVSGLTVFVFLASAGTMPWTKSLLEAIAMVLVTMTGYLINDIYDREKDLKARADKPIAKGQIDVREAIKISVLLAMSSLLISTIVSSIETTVVLILTISGVLLYSPFSQKVPIAKGIVTSVLCLAPFYYASVITSKGIHPYMYLSAFLFILGREVLLDTKDLSKDLQNGLRTLPFFLGSGGSKFLSWALMFAGGVSLLFTLTNWFAITLALTGIVMLATALYLDRNDEVPNAGLTIWTMVLCLLAIPFNS